MSEGEWLFRAMLSDQDGLPQVDASARTLGARPAIDVPGDASDEIDRFEGGMSASSGQPDNLPTHRRPPAFGGTGPDPIFAIRHGDLGHDLRWREDPAGPSGHGFLEPVRRMLFSEYQEALWATRSGWQRWDP